MKVRLLHTIGNGSFEEIIWDKPDPAENEIEVRAVMTGVCRSDIDMMQGNFGPLPLHMQGHEGLGIVTRIGNSINNVEVGDCVATRGEPAYADYYNCRENEFVVVPELEPKYILEPVACGINCVNQAIDEIRKRINGKFLIIGSGFLAWVVYNNLMHYFKDITIDVVGRSNKELFGDILLDIPNGSYDVVIDLGSGTEVFDQPILNINALIVFGVEKTITTNFQNLLWRACTMIFPSPRTDGFTHCMFEAKDLIESGKLNIDKFWTQAYNRNTNWKQAFLDGANRPNGYSRGYIKWD
jgi:hypothetical protein